PPGEMVSAWLPIPRSYPFQGDFQLLSTSSKPKQIAPLDSSIRSLYLERPAKKDNPTQFKVEYSYTTHGVSFDLKPEDVRPCDPDEVALQPFTRQAPHVVFTPEIRALSQQIAGDEPNPMLKAKRFYDWIAEQIKYSYVIEYSTIRNIS